MKQILLTITMALGICTFVNAQTTPEKAAETTASTTVQTPDDGFAKVEMDALNQKIQTAIKENYSDFTVKALAYNAEKKLTKVTFVSKEGKEMIVLLNEEGKEVKE